MANMNCSIRVVHLDGNGTGRASPKRLSRAVLHLASSSPGLVTRFQRFLGGPQRSE
jgi:hypothetical protein